jgi:hypothetical protein
MSSFKQYSRKPHVKPRITYKTEDSVEDSVSSESTVSEEELSYLSSETSMGSCYDKEGVEVPLRTKRVLDNGNV